MRSRLIARWWRGTHPGKSSSDRNSHSFLCSPRSRSSPARYWPATRSGRSKAPWIALAMSTPDRDRATDRLSNPDCRSAEPFGVRSRLLKLPSRRARRSPWEPTRLHRGAASERDGRRDSDLASGSGHRSASSNSGDCYRPCTPWVCLPGARRASFTRSMTTPQHPGPSTLARAARSSGTWPSTP